MKKTDNTKLITVGQLVRELKRYEKKHWDWNVEISTDESIGEDEGIPCIIIGMGLDEDGDLRIEIEDEWAGGGDYYVVELLEQLKDFDTRTRVYLAGGGLLFSIDSQGGIFADSDDDDDTLSCYATAFGEYVVDPAVEAPKVKKTVRTDHKGTIALAVVTAVIFFGLCYNVYVWIAHTGQPVWESVMWIVVCIILLVVSGGKFCEGLRSG